MTSAPPRSLAEARRVGAALARGGATALGALLALPLLLATGLLCLVGLGLPLLPEAARAVRRLAGAERRRVDRALGTTTAARYRPLDGPLPERLRVAVSDRAGWRDLRWLPVHGLSGLLAAFLGLGLPLAALNNLTMPLWWWAVPGAPPSSVGFPVDSWARAAVMPLFGALLAAVSWLLAPRLLTGQARLSRALLLPPAGVSLAERLAEVTASRAAALEAHGAELRRIERDLHDGTQNRLVAVVMRVGLLERALLRGAPEEALPLALGARQAATEALDELRDVLRGIYPPVLDERGLDGAVAALAARCPVPCVVETEGLRRGPAAVETAAYFVTAEALNNVAKHSRATLARVRLTSEESLLVIEVTDDGVGGAEERAGTGLAGMRRRAAALDGRLRVDSPPGGPTRLRVELPCGW
ncbi:sensor histidine kinase [Streptomyces sp. NPDC127098]|uniref:sensor histidine kinase n=1 Tax=Streptomyces sp. NPDC127098 TaxID=3347137 RepID=UPI0036502F36